MADDLWNCHDQNLDNIWHRFPANMNRDKLRQIKPGDLVRIDKSFLASYVRAEPCIGIKPGFVTQIRDGGYVRVLYDDHCEFWIDSWKLQPFDG